MSFEKTALGLILSAVIVIAIFGMNQAITLNSKDSYTISVYGGKYHLTNADNTTTDRDSFYEVASMAVGNLTNGGTLKILDGVYYTSNDRIIITATNLKIEGSGNTIITQETEANNTYFFQLLDSRNCVIDNIIFDGNKDNNNFTWSLLGLTGNSQHNTIQNSVFKNSVNFGIALFGTSFNNTIIQNTVLNNGNSGIFLQYDSPQDSFNLISNNHIGTLAWGIGLQFANRNTITGNIITQSNSSDYNEGINIDSSSFNIVSNNQIVNTGDVGIAIHNQIKEGNSEFNTISDNTISGVRYYGIHLVKWDSELTTNIQYNTIRGNTITNSSWWGIYEQLSGYNTISDDMCIDNVLGGIYTVSPNTHVSQSWNNTQWID